MPRYHAFLRPGLLLLVLLVAACEDGGTSPAGGDPAAGYAGSARCEPCHAGIVAIWAESGHPHALTAVDGAAPVDRFRPLAAFPADPVGPPIPYSWPDIPYVAGGYGWKMLWINPRGYPMRTATAEDRIMYSFADRRWTYWGSYASLRDPADCGGCHATGWVPDTDWATDGDLSDNQDGLEGMAGRWFAPGVHCEACHGRGARHAEQPDEVRMTVDRSAADCGRCHTKDPGHDPLAGRGFLTPNSQYDAWLHSAHALGRAVVGCVDCHDPHASVKHDDVAAGEGTFASCAGCHPRAAAVNRHDAFAPTACVDCHMPFAVRSATAPQPYAADMRTHLVDIAVTAAGREEGMGIGDATAPVAQDTAGRARITLDLACYGCHRDADGRGGGAAALSLARLAEFAAGIHRATGNDGR